MVVVVPLLEILLNCVNVGEVFYFSGYYYVLLEGNVVLLLGLVVEDLVVDELVLVGRRENFGEEGN